MDGWALTQIYKKKNVSLTSAVVEKLDLEKMLTHYGDNTNMDVAHTDRSSHYKTTPNQILNITSCEALQNVLTVETHYCYCQVRHRSDSVWHVLMCK